MQYVSQRDFFKMFKRKEVNETENKTKQTESKKAEIEIEVEPVQKHDLAGILYIPYISIFEIIISFTSLIINLSKFRARNQVFSG